MLAAALYFVTAITLPRGKAVDVTAENFGSDRAPNAPPSTFALSRSGSLAMLVRPEVPDGNGAAQILVVRADGTRVTLRLPPNAVLAKAFRTFPSGPQSNDAPSGARFSGIALAADGTPFATVAYPFSGAYSGTEDTVFAWNGKRWRDVLDTSPLPIDTRNLTIAAVDAPRRFACNANYFDAPAQLDALESDPHTQEDQALLMDGPTTVKLGYGAVTAMRGRFIVGYTNGARSFTISGEPPHKSTALEWIAGQRTALGPGIAYGVNARGDAVGDDDPVLAGEGTPTLWRDGRAIRLSRASGSAYAIGDDGTIVGEVHDTAFLIRGADTARKLIRIDDLLAKSAWHITAAYALAANGRIVAAGREGTGPLHLLLLEPAPLRS